MKVSERWAKAGRLIGGWALLLAFSGWLSYTLWQSYGGMLAKADVCPGSVGRQAGECAGDFHLASLGAQAAPEVSLARQAGKPTVLYFWASHCAPSMQFLPYLIGFQLKHRDKLNILLVNNRTTEREVEGDADVHKAVSAVLRQAGRAPEPGTLLVSDEATHKTYKPRATPAIFFLDPTTKIVEVVKDIGDEKEFEAKLQALIATYGRAAQPATRALR